MAPVTLHLRPDQYERLKALAAARGVSMVSVVREAIEAILGQHK